MIRRATHLQCSTGAIHARRLRQLEQSAHCRSLLLRSLVEGLAPRSIMLLCKHKDDIHLVAESAVKSAVTAQAALGLADTVIPSILNCNSK